MKMDYPEVIKGPKGPCAQKDKGLCKCSLSVLMQEETIFINMKVLEMILMIS